MPDTTCTPAELSAAAACYACFDEHTQWAVIVRLLCAYLNGETMSCTPAELAAAAGCYNCWDDHMLRAVAISILCQMASGADFFLQGNGAPVGILPPTARLYFDRVGKILYVWDTNLEQWVAAA